MNVQKGVFIMFLFQGRSVKLDSSGSYMLQARAEVGLLTHNIVIRGSDNSQWHDQVNNPSS